MTEWLHWTELKCLFAGAISKSERPLLAEGLEEPQKLSILQLERILRVHIGLNISLMECGSKGTKLPRNIHNIWLTLTKYFHINYLLKSPESDGKLFILLFRSWDWESRAEKVNSCQCTSFSSSSRVRHYIPVTTSHSWRGRVTDHTMLPSHSHFSADCPDVQDPGEEFTAPGDGEAIHWKDPGSLNDSVEQRYFPPFTDPSELWQEWEINLSSTQALMFWCLFSS